MIETAAIARAQTALLEASREHKRLEFAHRKQARKLAQAAAELGAVLSQYGIAVHIGTDNRKES